MSLNIGRRILISHHCNIKRFLPPITDYYKFMPVSIIDSLLIKERGIIYYANELVAFNGRN